MRKEQYSDLSDDELFERFQHAAIQEQEAFYRHVDGNAPISEQHHWAGVLAATAQEIERRGERMHPRYLELLKSEHPEVRLIAALAARHFAQEAAVPVLEDLDDAAKYGGHIALDAGRTLDAMRKRGEIPPK